MKVLDQNVFLFNKVLLKIGLVNTSGVESKSEVIKKRTEEMRKQFLFVCFLAHNKISHGI